MEFRYRADEERGASSSSSPNGYFAEQALRAGFGIGSSGFIPPPMSRTEALLEELRRERIREELLAREIAHKRMLEEDIRRELEIERLMAMRRLEEERFLPKEMEMEGRVGFGVRGRLGAGFLLEDERSPSLGMPPRFREDIGMDEMLTPPRFGDVGYLDKPPVPRKSMVGKMELSKLLSKPGVSGSKDNKPSVHQVSGVKRKAASELPQFAMKEWGCSLCQVTATSQRALNKHVQGKKHKLNAAGLIKKHKLNAAGLIKNKLNAAGLIKNKATSKKLNASSLMAKEGDDPLDQAKVISASELATSSGAEAKMKQCKPSKAVWCNLCKVKCNTPAMLDCHLKGKKHKAQLTKKGHGVGSASPTAEVVKEVTEQNEQEVEVHAEDDAEATDQKGGEEVKAEDDAEATHQNGKVGLEAEDSSGATDEIGREAEVEAGYDAQATDGNGKGEVNAEDSAEARDENDNSEQMEIMNVRGELGEVRRCYPTLSIKGSSTYGSSCELAFGDYVVFRV